MPFEQMVALKAAAAAPAVEWVEFPQSAHMDAYVTDHQIYWPALRDFITKHVASGAASWAGRGAGRKLGGGGGGGGQGSGAAGSRLLGGGGGGGGEPLVAEAADARRDEL